MWLLCGYLDERRKSREGRGGGQRDFCVTFIHAGLRGMAMIYSSPFVMIPTD